MSNRNSDSIKDLIIRRGRISDIPVISKFIRELAEYEGISDRITFTQESLIDTLFGEKPAAETAMAIVNEEYVGFAVFYYTFSTILGERGLHLDDLYIKPEWRGKGLGTSMMKWLASVAIYRNCGRFEWWCMKTNTSSLEYYSRSGARILDDIHVLRLEGKEIVDFLQK
jgi:GNAT superfamily N-acetyltransferase